MKETASRLFLIASLILCLARLARCAEATVAWEYPTTSTDGAPLVDLLSTRLYTWQADVFTLSWTNARVYVGAGRWVTNRVVGGYVWSSTGTAMVIDVPAWTNAPVGIATDFAVLTNLVNNRVYISRASAVNSLGTESALCPPVVFAVGKAAASSVKMRLQ
jgi:hypothetical protein